MPGSLSCPASNCAFIVPTRPGSDNVCRWQKPRRFSHFWTKAPSLASVHIILFVQDAVQLPCSRSLSTFSVFLHYIKQFRSGKMCSTQKTTHSYCNSHKRTVLHTLLTLLTTFFLDSLLHFTICVPFSSFSASSIFPFSSVPHLHFPNSPPFFGHLRDSF